jgi:hypothetical protein
LGALVDQVAEVQETVTANAQIGATGAASLTGAELRVLPYLQTHHNLLARGINVDNNVPDAVERIRNVTVYPWSEREDPKPNKFVSISGALIDTTPPGGMEFWERLVTVIDCLPSRLPT